MWEMHLRPEAAIAELEDSLTEALKDTYALDILPEAVALAPRGATERLSRSIRVDVHPGPHGPEATLFTDCGYGAYVELGIKGVGGPGRKGGKRHHMAAQPYAMPAFVHGIKNFDTRTHVRLDKVALSAAQKEMRERNLNG